MTRVGQQSGIRRAAVFGAFALGSTLILWSAAGYSFNLFLAGMVAATTISPVFAVHGERVSDTCLLVLGGMLGVGGGWLGTHHSNFGDVARTAVCTGVVAAVIWCVAEVARLLVGVGIDKVLVGACGVVSAAVWLSWPVWAETAPPLLVRLQPVMAINGVVSDDLGIWTEQPVVYPWTELGQDLSYRLPRSPWACVAMHLGVGCVATTLGVAVGRMRGRSSVQ